MAEPGLHTDPGLAKKLGRRYAELGQLVDAHRELAATAGDLGAARELARDDEDFAAELPALERAHEAARERLRTLLVPRDPDDDRDVILEVKAGGGGEEPAPFPGDPGGIQPRDPQRQGGPNGL